MTDEDGADELEDTNEEDGTEEETIELDETKDELEIKDDEELDGFDELGTLLELLELELELELGPPQQQNHQAITHLPSSTRSHLDRTLESVRNTFRLGKSSILSFLPPYPQKRLLDPILYR